MDTSDNVFVGRGDELTVLRDALGLAAEGTLQICLVEGDPGDGKTTLVEHFAQDAKCANQSLDYAIGTCDIYTGKHDIYDPFRDIFAQLTGIRAKSVGNLMVAEREFDTRNLIQITTKTLMEFAPELIGTLIPGASLISKVVISTADKVTQRRIKITSDKEEVKHEEIRKQSVAFFEKRASNQSPLIVILDDVQWMDQLSLELLEYLIEKIKRTAMLLILTYRPDEPDASDGTNQVTLPSLIKWINEKRNPPKIDLRESRSSRERGLEFVKQFLERNNITAQSRANCRHIWRIRQRESTRCGPECGNFAL